MWVNLQQYKTVSLKLKTHIDSVFDSVLWNHCIDTTTFIDFPWLLQYILPPPHFNNNEGMDPYFVTTYCLVFLSLFPHVLLCCTCTCQSNFRMQIRGKHSVVEGIKVHSHSSSVALFSAIKLHQLHFDSIITAFCTRRLTRPVHARRHKGIECKSSSVHTEDALEIDRFPCKGVSFRFGDAIQVSAALSMLLIK